MACVVDVPSCFIDCPWFAVGTEKRKEEVPRSRCSLERCQSAASVVIYLESIYNDVLRDCTLDDEIFSWSR